MKHFHVGAASGLIAVAAANGVLFAWRNPNASPVKQYIQRVRFGLAITTPATAAQELTIELVKATFVDNYTGADGSIDLLTAIRHRSLDKQRVLASSQIPVSAATSGDIRIAGTAAMTAGATGPTIDSQPWSRRGMFLPATASAIVIDIRELVIEWGNPAPPVDHEVPDQGCMQLAANDGFLVRMPIAAGAALVTRLYAEVEWLE